MLSFNWYFFRICCYSLKWCIFVLEIGLKGLGPHVLNLENYTLNLRETFDIKGVTHLTSRLIHCQVNKREFLCFKDFCWFGSNCFFCFAQTQIQYLKQVQQPSVAQLRSTMVDPAINLFFLKMKGELEQTKDKLEQAQNELSAWKFTPDR